ncbi:MAG: pyridoxal-phosphate dependent enzyme, partial [Patescibacteria group bacterium]|nr:pyridoxal-phosphate dependent enzyme [Patescibacteria group bacterium]
MIHGNTYQEASDYAHQIAEEKKLVYVGSFHSERFFAGNATIMLEIIEDNPEIDTVIAPIGGGGLMAGISFAAKKINPNIKIYGVQAEGCSSMYQSLKENHPVTIENAHTIADGVAVRRPSDLSYSYVKEYMDDMFLVSDQDIKKAVTLLHSKAKLVTEGAGAAAT